MFAALRAARYIWLLALIATTTGAGKVTDWPVFGHDAARSGNDSEGGGISTNNVGRLRERWRVTLGTIADSAPILLSNVRVHGAPRTMVFQTAEDGISYGVDARTGRILWRFATHGPNITTSTPAADSTGRWIYVPGLDGFVHKLDAASGVETRGRGFPVRISRMPASEKDASALNVANGYLYAVTSGYLGDATPYLGHIVTVRLNDGTTHVFNTLCSDQHALPTPTSCSRERSGIWARGGAVVDNDPSMRGRIYVATGNGNFNARGGGHDYGDSVLALSADGTKLLGYYTPQNYASLESGDTDLGSSSPALLPRDSHSRTPLMLVQGGKDALLRLLDRAHLPGVGGELQRLDIGAELYSTPAVSIDRRGRTWIYLGLPNGVRAFRLVTDARGNSRLVQAWNANVGQTEEGTSPIVSNGIVFIAMSGALHALDAQSGYELWRSTRSSARHSIGAVHWQSPIVANGWVYCSDGDGNLNAYALP